jgi:hypothetical protein
MPVDQPVLPTVVHEMKHSSMAFHTFGTLLATCGLQSSNCLQFTTILLKLLIALTSAREPSIVRSPSKFAFQVI